MKKLFTLIAAIALFANSFAASFPKAPVANATEIMVPLGKNGGKVSLQTFANMSVKQYEAMTGEDMKLKQKIAFKLVQKEFRKAINPDNSVNLKKLDALNKKVQRIAADKSKLKMALILLGVAVILALLGIAVPIIGLLGLIVFIGSLVYFIIYFASM